jgi:hypothetical protein
MQVHWMGQIVVLPAPYKLVQCNGVCILWGFLISLAEDTSKLFSTAIIVHWRTPNLVRLANSIKYVSLLWPFLHTSPKTWM